jgi:sodium transport system ATP-binding protein
VESAQDRGPLVEVEGLVRRYGDLVAVDGVSFEVHGGEIFGLLGPNGAGKSTTLRMLATLIQPDAGAARICGFDTRKNIEQVRRRIGFQTGDTRLYERLTPIEFLRYFGDLHDMSRDVLEPRIETLIDAMGIGDFSGRRCGTLSTGQQQRVSIARSLLHDPAVLILDEPTSGLDIISGQFILEFLEREKDRGKAIVFSTHIMSEAELLCDRLGLLYDGRLLAVDTMAAVLEQAGETSLTRAFLKLIGKLDETAARMVAPKA